jgi:peptide/nickel transport system substrate-binding protein
MDGNYWAGVMTQRIARRRMLKAGAAFSAGAAALALIGCSGDDEEPSSDAGSSSTPSSSAGQPKQGGHLGSYFASVGNFSVIANDAEGAELSGVNVYDRPVTARLDSKGYQLEAMEKIEIPDPLKVIMTLKPNMVFQDKAPVNGRAVKGSDIVAMQNFVKTATTTTSLAFQTDFLDRAEATNDRTVTLYLKKPSAYIFSSLYLANSQSQAIIPEEMLSLLDTTPAIGSGPYELADFTFGSRYLFRRNAKYRDADKMLPYIDERQLISLTDPVAQEAAFLSGQIHEWLPSASAVARLKRDLDASKFKSLDYLGTNVIGTHAMMNAQMGGPRPWHDVRVREAMYKAMNRQQFVDLVFPNAAVVATGPIHSSLQAYQLDSKDTAPYYATDIQAAKQLLTAANYDTSKTWEIVGSATNATNAQLGEVWAQQLSQIGIKCTVKPVPLSVLNPQMIATSKFDLQLASQPGGDTPARVIRDQASDTRDQFNNVGLYSPEIDALIEKSETSVDRDENVRIVKQIQMEALKLYSMSNVLITPQLSHFRAASLQDWEIEPLLGEHYQTRAWFSA